MSWPAAMMKTEVYYRPLSEQRDQSEDIEGLHDPSTSGVTSTVEYKTFIFHQRQVNLQFIYNSDTEALRCDHSNERKEIRGHLKLTLKEEKQSTLRKVKISTLVHLENALFYYWIVWSFVFSHMQKHGGASEVSLWTSQNTVEAFCCRHAFIFFDVAKKTFYWTICALFNIACSPQYFFTFHDFTLPIAPFHLHQFAEKAQWDWSKYLFNKKKRCASSRQIRLCFWV